MFQTVYNSTDRPVLIDAEGRTIEGRGWGSVDDSKPEVKEALKNESLVIVDDIGAGPGVNPRAAAAVAQTKALNGPSHDKTPLATKNKEKDS